MRHTTFGHGIIAGFSRTTTYVTTETGRSAPRVRVSGLAVSWPRRPRGNCSVVLRWHEWRVGLGARTYPNMTQIGGLMVTWRELSLGFVSLEYTVRWFQRDQAA